MRKQMYFYFSIFMVSIWFLGCQKEDVAIPDTPVASDITQPSDIDVNNLNSEAVTYYSNIKKAIFLTGSNLKKNNPSGANLLTVASNEQETNPLIEKLKYIDIVREDNSERVSFFEMDEIEQELFLKDWAIVQAEQMSRKIAENPELLEHIVMENEVVGSVLSQENIGTKSSGSSVKDSKDFFAQIQDRFAEKQKESEEKLAQEQNNQTNQSMIRSSNKNKKIQVWRLKNALAAHARRGDFLVALPIHGWKYIPINISTNQFKVGHAGIITHPTGEIPYDNPYDKENRYQNVSIGATMKHDSTGETGVRKEQFHDWCYQSYIVGIQKTTWKWRWRGFKSRYYRETIKVPNPEALANWADTYVGIGYVYIPEFLTAKWAAPSRFTCTTLVWWCAKKAYDINVSSWWASMVSPGGLLSDENTYTIHVIN